MKKYITVVMLLQVIFLVGQNYILDPTFGINGTRITNNDIKPSNGFFEGGQYYFFGNQSRFARYNYDGSIDQTFGNFGFSVISIPGKYVYLKDAIMHNGQLYGFGRTVSSLTGLTDALLIRITNDGLLDSTFGVNGVVEFDLGERESFNNILINPDGTMFAIGTKQVTAEDGEVLLCKFLDNGALDLGLNTSGYKLYPYGQISKGISLFTYDGDILLGNWTRAGSYSQIFLQKIDEVGEIMTDFGNNGSLHITVDVYGSSSSDNFKQLQLIGDRIYCSFYWGVSFGQQGYKMQSYSITTPNPKLSDTGIYSDSYFNVLDDGTFMVSRGIDWRLCIRPLK